MNLLALFNLSFEESIKRMNIIIFYTLVLSWFRKLGTYGSHNRNKDGSGILIHYTTIFGMKFSQHNSGAALSKISLQNSGVALSNICLYNSGVALSNIFLYNSGVAQSNISMNFKERSLNF